MQVSGADDRPGVIERKRGGIKHERLGLRATEPTVAADELFEGGNLSRFWIDHAHDENVGGIGEAIRPPQMSRSPRPERC